MYIVIGCTFATEVEEARKAKQFENVNTLTYVSNICT